GDDAAAAVDGVGGDAGGERAERAGRSRDGRADGVGVGQIDVGEGDGAAVLEVAGRGGELGDGAGDVGCGDHRVVVGSGDGDRNGPVDQSAVAVVERDGEGLELGLVLGQILDVGGGDAVAPGDDAAAAVDGVGGDAGGERAERAGRSRDGRADGVGVGQIDVGEGDGAAVLEVAGRGGELGDGAGDVGCGDHRVVVGSGDGDRNGPVDQSAVAVVERDGEGLELGLVLGQILDVGGGDAVAPGDDAAAAVDGVGGDAGGERAERAGRSRDGRADGVGVGQIDVGEGDGAAVLEVAGRGGELGDGAGDVGCGDHRVVVGSGDGDRNGPVDQSAVA